MPSARVRIRVTSIPRLGACALAVAATLAPARRAGGEGPSAEGLAADVRSAASKATPSERAAAAQALAARSDVTLEEWREAIAAFRPPTPPEPGERTVRVPLLVDGKVEDTEIATYVPRSAPRERAPLILALHFTGGRGGDMIGAWRAVADATGAIVVAPSEAGPNDGYRFSSRERDSGLETLRWARLQFGIDGDRVFVTGVSRGGHMAWDLALRRPDRFAAAAPMIGAPRITTIAGQNNMRFLENARDLPIRDLQGSKDDPNLVASLHMAFARLKAMEAKDAVLLEFPDLGHAYDFGAVDWKRFVDAVRRNPAPPRVLHRCATREEGRSFWLEALAFDGTVRADPQPIRPRNWDQLDETAQTRVRGRRSRAPDGAHRRNDPRPRPLLGHRDRRDARPPPPLARDAPREGPGRSHLDGRPVRKTATPSARVLLGDFVERLDRSFLPVAEVSVP